MDTIHLQTFYSIYFSSDESFHYNSPCALPTVSLSWTFIIVSTNTNVFAFGLFLLLYNSNSMPKVEIKTEVTMKEFVWIK